MTGTAPIPVTSYVRHSRAVVWACAASVVFHVGGGTALVLSRLHLNFGPHPDRLTDVVGATLLSFVPDEPPPVVTPEPQTPEAPAEVPVETAPAPVRVVDEAFGKTELVPPPPVEAPAAAPSMISDAPAASAVQTPPKPRVPRASFAGVEASPARRIVYLVDASGAMTSSLKFLKEELARSVARLHEDQSFQVTVFRQPVGSNETTLAHFAMDGSTPGLVGASRRTKVALAEWLPGVRPGGRSDVLAALEGALAQDPDLIFVLTRSINRSVGFDEQTHNARVLGALESLNARGITGHRRARIKTIQFLDDDPTGLLQEIARIHGDGEGSYRLVGRSEVLQQAREAAPAPAPAPSR